MSDASDASQPALPLTRRELRERERQASTAGPVSDATPMVTADAAVSPDLVASIVQAPLTEEAESVPASQLAEPDLEAAVVTESDRVIAAPAAADARDSDADILLTPGKTSTTSIPLPTRSQLRSDEFARTTRPRRLRVDEPDTTPAAAYAPQRTFVPASALPRASPHAQPVSDRMRKFVAKSMTVAAMSFVALMAVSTSLPAQALLSTADVQASALAAQRPSQDEGVQTLDLAGGDTITVERDGYETSTIAEFAAASGIRMEATFTNNPNGTIQWPFAVGVHIGDQIGPRSCAGCSANHGGQDFNPGLGAPIQSIADGVVSLAEDGEGSLGVHMIIDHMIDGKLVSSVYAHMIHGSMNFKTGDVVKVGQVIGKTGSTGMSTGPHLHFEIRDGGIDGTKIDPLAWLYANTN
ncbi:M23 family metallopeptidase [Cryobacterium roopkundense]|uniref:Murein DD-endopeptidase MepM/ murein hydrolase activator NlpD n=1 Tax=Cryobacterium roopkundense TaxID=1001240 RepID=A0A7W9A0W0_9MICO|nr:M23 family metallopeptidase [Cryobacterium roopkundense]MBB5643500.1 murein DD-endopeptidase MepM/ murein hydrolase activator NlpD [Cryobacterium roopkundense]